MFADIRPTLGEHCTWDAMPELPASTQLVILDVDGTITLDGKKELDPQAIATLHDWTHRGVTLHLLTNNLHSPDERFAVIAAALGSCGWSRATPRKPSPKPFQAILDSYTLPANAAVVIGDQLLTDILGGNRANIPTILMRRPQREPWFMRIPRAAEWLIRAVQR
jgi:uncharacterized protein